MLSDYYYYTTKYEKTLYLDDYFGVCKLFLHGFAQQVIFAPSASIICALQK